MKRSIDLELITFVIKNEKTFLHIPPAAARIFRVLYKVWLRRSFNFLATVKQAKRYEVAFYYNYEIAALRLFDDRQAQIKPP